MRIGCLEDARLSLLCDLDEEGQSEARAEQSRAESGMASQDGIVDILSCAARPRSDRLDAQRRAACHRHHL